MPRKKLQSAIYQEKNITILYHQLVDDSHRVFITEMMLFPPLWNLLENVKAFKIFINYFQKHDFSLFLGEK